MHQVLQQIAAFATLAVVGCSPSAEAVDAGVDPAPDATAKAEVGSAEGPIIDQSRWVAADSAGDPFDDRPTSFDCEPDVGWGVEELEGAFALEVATGSCDYLAVTQPTLSEIKPGERLLIHFIHFELTGDGEAHVALALDDAMVWEKRIAMPQESFEVYEEEFTVPDGAPAGTPLVFHLHNHGTNTYNLVDVRRVD